MAYNVLIQNLVQASSVDALNRSFVVPTGATYANGQPVVSGALSTTTGEGEVFACAAPSGKALGIWMIYEPEVVVTDGKYKGLNPNVQDFSMVAGDVVSGFKPMVGDILTFTIIGSDTFAGGDTDAQVAANGAFVWNSSALTDSFNMRLIDTTYISIPTGLLGATGRPTAYKFEVTAN